jgi:adhesin transport system membrane fusion protein
VEDQLRHAKDFAREIKGGSPLRSSLLLLLIILFLFIAALWAANTELDAVTRGDGRVVPSGEVQVVQSSEPGVISEIHVVEGALVNAGDPLLTLDDTQIEGELAQTLRRVQSLRLRISRLQAEIDGTEFQDIPDLDEVSPVQLASEKALFAARRIALTDEVAVLERQAVQRAQEVKEAAIRVETARTTLALVAEELAVIRPLVAENVEPRTSLITLLGRQAEATGRMSEAEAALVRAQSAQDEIADRVVSTRSGMRASALGELVQAEAELGEVLSVLPALETRLTRSVLIAPTHGIVNRVLMTTVGGLARAGEPLVEIVPIEDELLVEAYLDPADVAFVRPGQDVRVTITAYDPSRYGTMDARIVRIGADAITRPDRDTQAFVVEIQTLDTLTDADGRNVEILPGMIAQVDILSGKRSVLDYLTAPIVRVKDTAFRD